VAKVSQLCLSALVVAAPVFAALAACDDEPAPPEPRRRVTPAPSASDPFAVEAPAPDGCARSGSLEAIAEDPSCVITRADEHLARDALRRVKITLEADPPKTVGGGSSVLRLAIRNMASSETLLPLEAHPPGSGPRPNWRQLAGVREPKSPNTEHPRLLFPLTTLGASGRNVDGFTAAPAQTTPGETKILGVRMRPGAKLTQVISWWAYRIPAVLPPFRNDAGYVVVPKTAPSPLSAGEYTVRVDLPIYGLSTEERSVSVHVVVERIPKPPRDAGREALSP
jgi:hypothetical protein